MPVKPVYVIEDRRWLPMSRAAALLATNTAVIKRFMGDGTLEWRQLAAGSATFVVEEAGVLRLRAERKTAATEVKRRTAAPLRTVKQRGKAMGLTERQASAVNALIWAERPRLSVFDRTWDPSPLPLPVSGRDPRKPKP